MLIVPFVVEVTFSGTYGDRNWANVQHLVWNADSGDRSQAGLDDIALTLEGAYASGIAQAQNNKVILTNVKVADLDSAGGLVANLPGTSTGDRNVAASGPQVSVLVSKIDGHTRSQRPGRMFLPGLAESDTDADLPGRLNAAAQTLWDGAVFAYFASCSGTAAGENFFPCVLHKSTAPGGLTPYAQTGVQVQALLATQRRRLRG